ncbi:MAG: ABC transporter substrate-binding protein [Betaproteobacteria bacterium]|nr:ABC transporter substrate-binding protein [Betaproteobacteria bacterium]
MNRRDALRALFTTLLASPCALPNPARAQPRVLRVVYVTGNSKESVTVPLAAFREELKALGYVEARNLSFDVGYGEFSRERTRKLSAEAMAKKPDIILASHGAVHTFSELTKTTPIIAIYSGDMVEAKLVKSLARPGVNITGVQLLGFDLVGKRIEILKELVPSIKRLAVFAMSAHPGLTQEREVSVAAAKQLGISIVFFPLANPQDLDAGLTAAQARGVDGVVLFPDPITLSGAPRIAAFALEHKLPVVSGWYNYADAGGLVSYGPNLREAWRRVASHFDRVAKGADPATLPIELPTIIELVLNLKTARALKVKVPQSVLVRADRVIE